MVQFKLTYFDAPTSRGEECRLALFAAGVDFVDNRIARADWPALKPTTPFGSLPVLEIEGKPPISQSNTILAYVGRRFGLLPKDEWEALRLESLLGACEDLRGAVAATFGIADADELKRRRAALVEGPLRAWAGNMEKQISGPFAGGSELSVADIKLFILTNWFKKGVLDHVPADALSPFAKLEAVRANVSAHPKIVAWYARPQ